MGGMWIGDVVANRFVIERLIGSGGMGSVFLATDRASGRPVAVKVLDVTTDVSAERFRREARVLSELSHPGIVRYVAQGESTNGQLFLAMELLEGRNLAEALAKRALSLEESLSLLRRAAEALAFAHDRGVVHRDIKPSNLFLVDGDVERLKVLDFGIARVTTPTVGLTHTGTMLGTVGYMAPEQVTASHEADERADVFALGCVLFECLTGQPAFGGAHAVAVLAKVLAADAPRVSQLRPGLGSAVDAFVSRMLAKNREERPRDARDVLDELDALDARTTSVPPPALSTAPRTLTHSEQRIVAVILARPAADVATSATSTPEQASHELEAARDVARRFGADLGPLSGGSLIFVLSGRGAASDLAVRAAACMLAAESALPALRLALATGRAETTGRLPVGVAIDRAAVILFAADLPPSGSFVDDATAALIGARFIVRSDGRFHVLVGDVGDEERPRLLLGKATPTVGREKELGLLEATLTECVDDSVARVVIVTGPPGAGKSRLGNEFRARTRRHGRARVLIARGEAASGTSLVRQLVFGTAGLREDESLDARRTSFYAYVEALISGNAGRLAADFLGEALGLISPRAPTPELVAARNDPRIMADRFRQAVLAWLDAETSREPLALVLEDLHWADAASVAHLEEALSRLSDRPLFVLALARPEASDLFPKLFSTKGVHEIKLSTLTRRAAERLVRATLGEGTDLRVVSRIVERAAGHAFYLEELIRAAAEGRDELPESVMAMATSRLERLEPDARRVLRAASVYGEVFWPGAVGALLGGQASVIDWLETLADREVLDRVRESRLAGERQFTFRHALLRDAAYGMLTDSDRIAGHALAGEWLATRAESEPSAIAEHFDRGNSAERASPWFVKALNRGLNQGSSLKHLRHLADRALTSGASGSERGRVRAAQARAWLTEDTRATLEAGREAVELLSVREPAWFWGAGAIMRAAAFSGNAGAASEILKTVLQVDPMPRPTGPMGWCLFSLSYGMLAFGQPDRAALLLRRFEDARKEAESRGEEIDPAFLGYEAVTRCLVVLLARDDVPGGLSVLTGADENFLLGGDLRSMPHAVLYRGLAMFEAGAVDLALAEFERAQRLDIENENTYIASLAQSWSGMALLSAGRVEGRDILLPFLTAGNSLTRPVAQVELAAFALRKGDAREAERLLPSLANVETEAPVWHRVTLALHAAILLSTGAADDAVTIATRASAGQERTPMLPHHRSLILLTEAICLDHAGRREEAERAMLRARERLTSLAARFPDPATRRYFLENLEANTRTLAIASEWNDQLG